MSVRIHCDSPICNKTRPEDSERHSWICVQDHGIVTTGWGSSLTERELHFCSRGCLVYFLTEASS